jgi:hypothetical protein
VPGCRPGELVAAGRLGPIERGIGPLQQLLGRGRLVTVKGGNAGAQRQHATGSSRWLGDGEALHRASHPLHRYQRGVQGLLGQDKQELLPTVAVHAVAPPRNSWAMVAATTRSAWSPAWWPWASL